MRYIRWICITMILLLPTLGYGKTSTPARKKSIVSGLEQNIYTVNGLMKILSLAHIRHQRHEAYSFHEWYQIQKVTTYMQEYRHLTSPYDLINDDSLTRYVSVTTPYSHPLYKPRDLIAIETNRFIRNNSIDPLLLREEASTQLEILAKDFYDEFRSPLMINSAWRSYHEQQNRFEPLCFSQGLCALPGTSEHQSGLAVDISLQAQHSTWMQSHAHLYGFHQSYQKPNQSDGLQVEPRHRRYLGIPLATELYEQQLPFSDRYELHTQ